MFGTETVAIIVNDPVFFLRSLRRGSFGIGISCWVRDFPSKTGFERVSGAVC